MVIGIPINEFQEISSFELSTEYIMPLSQRDKYVHSTFNSRKIELYQLLNLTSQKVSSMIQERFGTMAYMDISSFAESDHLHPLQYSNIKNEGITLFYDENDTDVQLLGKIFVNGQLSNVYYDKTKNGQIDPFSYDNIEPRIGTLRFRTSNYMRDIDITRQDFDGWVYTDGKTYNIEDFINQLEILNTLSISTKGDKFTVPSIGNYILADNGISCLSDMYQIETFKEFRDSKHSAPYITYVWNIPSLIYIGLSKWSK